MRVVIANFGRGNWAWPECLKDSKLAVMDDERLHSAWVAGDREAYIHNAITHLRLASGGEVTKQVASRWYNLNTLFAETEDDIWIHREKDAVWWTTSLADPRQERLMTDPRPRVGSGKNRSIYLSTRPCTPWSNTDKLGRPLLWPQLHAKAREFLFTEGTAQQLAPDNAAYALALLNGESLKPWHGRADWTKKEQGRKKYAGTYYDERRKTIVRMAMGVFGTAAQSGAVSLAMKKDKQVHFAGQQQLETYLSDLLEEQEGRCRLTDLPMLMDDGDDPRRLCSVDRIDSGGHYAPGNIQLVCQFANFWKRGDTNEEFARLLGLVRGI